MLLIVAKSIDKTDDLFPLCALAIGGLLRVSKSNMTSTSILPSVSNLVKQTVSPATRGLKELLWLYVREVIRTNGVFIQGYSLYN